MVSVLLLFIVTLSNSARRSAAPTAVIAVLSANFRFFIKVPSNVYSFTSLFLLLLKKKLWIYLKSCRGKTTYFDFICHHVTHYCRLIVVVIFHFIYIAWHSLCSLWVRHVEIYQKSSGSQLNRRIQVWSILYFPLAVLW